MNITIDVLFDHQIFSLQNYGGISRYFYELITSINENFHGEGDGSMAAGEAVAVRALTYPFFSNNHYLDSSSVPFRKFLPNLDFRGKQRLIRLVNFLGWGRKIRGRSFDLFHPTYYDPGFLDHLQGRPFVLTIYDMIHEKFPQYFAPDDQTGARKRLLAEKAAMIIAISENTKRDVITFLGIPEEKVRVIYLGNSFDPGTIELVSRKASESVKLPERYVLFTGCRNNYKNFDLFIDAVAVLMKKDESLFVVAAGGGAFTSAERQNLLRLGISDRIIQLNPDDSELIGLYSKARAFVFPSLYEGFGIPVLEAFSCGCPLLCSNQGSLPEIAAQGGAFFDSLSRESLVESLVTVLYNENERENLIIRGRERLRDFSWSETARQTADLYREIIY